MSYGDTMGYSSMISPDITVFAVLIIAAAILLSFANLLATWGVFTKAGVPGWAALIPFYSSYKLCQIATGNGLTMFLLWLPGVNVVALFWINVKLAYAFGKSVAFGLGLVFLSPLFMLLLAFGDADYVGFGGYDYEYNYTDDDDEEEEDEE